MKDEVIKVIRMALNGTIEQEEVAHFLSHMAGDPPDLYTRAVHIAVHYLTDEDIREKDPEYDQIMREKLENYITEIEESQL